MCCFPIILKPGLGQGLGKRLKLHSKKAFKNAGFATSLPSTMFQACGHVEAVGFNVQQINEVKRILNSFIQKIAPPHSGGTKS